MQLPGIQPVVIGNQVKTEEQSRDYGGPSFSQVLAGAINKVNDAQLRADQVTEKFLTGDVQDIHQVLISMEEARLTMQLAVEVRNKIVEAYQEISRMQI